MTTVLFRLEGVLADCKPGDHLPGTQPHLDARRLFLVFSESVEIVVSTDSTREYASFWLRSNGYANAVTSLYSSEQGTLEDHIAIARRDNDVDFVIVPPNEAAVALATGTTVLAWGRPAFPSREFRPDIDTHRTWAEMVNEIDMQRQLVPDPPDDDDGKFER